MCIFILYVFSFNLAAVYIIMCNCSSIVSFYCFIFIHVFIISLSFFFLFNSATPTWKKHTQGIPVTKSFFSCSAMKESISRYSPSLDKGDPTGSTTPSCDRSRNEYDSSIWHSFGSFGSFGSVGSVGSEEGAGSDVMQTHLPTMHFWWGRRRRCYKKI